MVGNTFKINDQLKELRAKLHGAFAVLETLNMAAFKLVIQQVNDLLDRLYLLGEISVSALKSGNRLFKRVAYSAGQVEQLALGAA